MQRRRLLKAAGMVFSDVYEGFLIHINRLAASTQIHYNRDLLRFFASAPKNLSNITAEHIERHLSILHRNMKASSVNTSLMTLKAFFHWLEENHSTLNPSRTVKKLPEMPRNQRTITKEEYKKLIEANTGNRRLIIVWLGNVGMRAGEFLSLKPENITDGFVTVYGQKSRKYRKIPINGNIQTILDSYPDFFNLIKNKRRNWLYKQIKKAGKKAGLNKSISPHTFRHRFATSLVAAGVPRDKVAKMMGITVTTLEKVYLHLDDLDLQGTTDCLT